MGESGSVAVTLPTTLPTGCSSATTSDSSGSSALHGRLKTGGCSFTSRMVMVTIPVACWAGDADESITRVVIVTTAAAPRSRCSVTKMSPVVGFTAKKFLYMVLVRTSRPSFILQKDEINHSNQFSKKTKKEDNRAGIFFNSNKLLIDLYQLEKKN